MLNLHYDKIVRVSKLDAARRQLATAIELWFHNGDPVSVYTLVFAAHEIIHTLFRRQGHAKLLYDSIDKNFVIRSKNLATFSKHAQRDPDGTTAFNADINEGLIITCLQGLIIMKETLNSSEGTFYSWTVIEKPELLPETGIISRHPANFREDFRGMSKEQFFKRFQMAWR